MQKDEYVLHGPPPSQDLPNTSAGKLLYDKLLNNPNDHDAFVDAHTGKSMSYAELLGKSCSLAKSLLRRNYGKDRILAICSENSLEFFIPILAALFIGAISAPINFNYTQMEMVHFFSIIRAKIVFCSLQVHKKFVELKDKLDFINEIVILDSEEEILGTKSLMSFIKENLKEEIYEFCPIDVNPKEQIALILSSSGTTGLPKGVMLTHRNITAKFCQAMVPEFVQSQNNIVDLIVLPLFHTFALNTSLCSLFMGQKTVIINKFEEDFFLKTIEKYKINRMPLVPSLAVFLVKNPLVKKYDLSSVNDVLCGSAPLSHEIEELVKKQLDIRYFRQAYGLTETTNAVLSVTIGDEKLGSVGKIMSYMSVKVRESETGKTLGPGQVGELCFKGEMIMKGYYNNEEATLNSFKDGWFLSGDLGYYDKDGYFFIVDRLKELIKYKGYQVAPAELEAVLLSHPDIKDAGVVGVKDDEVGELPLAFVVKNAKANIVEEEILKFVSEKVSFQKKLRGGVIFVNNIPKTPNGKVLRRELRLLLKKYKGV